MERFAIVKKFIKKEKYVIYPLIRVKDKGSYAAEPFFTGFNVPAGELINQVLNALNHSKEGVYPNLTPAERRKNFLKNMGVKTMQELHADSISLEVYQKDEILEFTPWQNKGPKNGFVPFKDNLTIALPADSHKKELAEALELTLSRCK